MVKELVMIQTELVATKNQFNKFNGFYYRSCEDILENLKPLLKKAECELILSDTIELIGNRYYIKATATIINKDGESVSATGYAREDEQKKGMDSSQLTGATSSYARKYALNGLFCIDDNKDVDVDNGNQPSGKSKKSQAVIPPFPPQQLVQQQVGDILEVATARIMGAQSIPDLTEIYKTFFNQLTEEQKKRFTGLCTSRRKQIEANGTK
jgi:hypothetical protein